jgi:hypothetical protein
MSNFKCLETVIELNSLANRLATCGEPGATSVAMMLYAVAGAVLDDDFDSLVATSNALSRRTETSSSSYQAASQN